MSVWMVENLIGGNWSATCWVYGSRSQARIKQEQLKRHHYSFDTRIRKYVREEPKR